MRACFAFICFVLSGVLFAQEKPRPEIVANYLYQDQPPFALQEVGGSAPAKLEDQVHIKVTRAATKEKIDDSRWIIHAADSVGKEVKSKHEAVEPLRTEGQYVFVSYTVENLLSAPARIPEFGLLDDKDRKFYPLEYSVARKYLPAEFDDTPLFINAGLKKKYCSIYELPAGAKPVAVLLLPLCVKEFNRSKLANISGKKVTFAEATEVNGKPTTAGQAFMLTMKCKRTENVEEKVRRAVSVRSLGYTVELKLLNAPEKEVQVKAFFMGESGSKRLMISEIVEKQVTVASSKAMTLNVACQPVTENDRQNEGLELKGVIIQAWADGKLMQSYTSQFSWKKYADMPDVLTQFEMYKPRKNRQAFRPR